MNNKLIILGVAILLISVGLLSGCEEIDVGLSNEEKRFVGDWEYVGTVGGVGDMVFFSDGTYSGGYGNEFEVKDGKLVIIRSDGYQYAFDYIFSNNDNNLTTIIDNLNCHYIRK